MNHILKQILRHNLKSILDIVTELPVFLLNASLKRNTWIINNFLQVKADACRHIGIDPGTISGVLRKFRNVAASMRGPGQLVSTVTQLHSENELTVSTFLGVGNKIYLKFSDEEVELENIDNNGDS